MSENQAIVKKETFEALLNRPDFQEKLQTVLPKHMTPKRVVQIALLAMSRQQTLYECTPASILNSVMKAGELGLDCVGTLGQGYLVPFWNSRIRAMECQFIPGYQGLITLARRSGQIKKIEARIVREGDAFRARYGTNAEIIHEPKIPPTGAPVAYYAVATLSDGTSQFEIMTLDEIEQIKSRSQSKNRNGEIVGPWATDFDEMAKKTVVRRLCKYLPLSPEIEKALEADNEQYESEPERIVISSQDKGMNGLKNILQSASTGINESENPPQQDDIPDPDPSIAQSEQSEKKTAKKTLYEK